MSERKVSRVVAVVVLAAAIAGCGSNDPAKLIASAEKYLAQSNYPAAIIELKNALSQTPDNAQARFLLAKASLQAGDPVAATTEFRKALVLKYPADDVYPLLALAMLRQGSPINEIQELANAPVQSVKAKAGIAATIGLANLGAGQLKEARTQIDAALALEPSNLSARLAQARLAAAERDLPVAMQRIDAVLATVPDNVDALMLKSEIELASGRRADVVRTLERVVALQPNAFAARYLLASNYIQLKEIDKANAQVDALKKLAPKDPRTLHLIGMVAFARGDVPAALDAVQEALRTAPNYLPARYLSGLVDMNRGAYGAAEQSFRTVLANSPDDVGARTALAQTLLRRGQAVKAQETLEPVLRSQPESVGALRLAAEIQIALKSPGRATEFIERANALDMGNVNGQVRLAQVRLAKGETAEGLRDLEKLSAADPSKREPDVALISAYMRTREYDKALAAADALIKKEPKSPLPHNAKGSVYAAKRDLKNARLSYEKALALEPNYAPALFNLATLDAAERNFGDAKKRYDQVLAKDPKSERALLGLVQLQVAANANPAEIVAALQRAVDANPQSVPSRVALISFHGKQKDWRAAIAAGQAAHAAIPDAPPILEALALAQLTIGEKNQAIETYARQAKLQPDNSVPLVRIAGIHVDLKNYDAAILSLKNALAVAPTNGTIWVALAAVFVEANQADAGYAEARRLQKDLTTRTAGYALEAELLAAQKKYPEAVAAYRTTLVRAQVPLVAMRLHRVLLTMGKPGEAASLAQNWLKDHPKDVPVRTYLGQQSLAKGDFKTAATYFRAALEVEPENLTLLNDLAWSLAEVKDPKAVEYAERAYRMAPGNPAIANTYGWALVQSGDSAQGITMLRRAVDIDPADGNKRLYLAKALIKTGDKPAARKELEIVAKAESPSARSQAEQLLKDL